MTGQTADTIREVQVLKMLRHPHIIRYYTSFVEEGAVCIVMEYAEGGDLQMLLKDHKRRNKRFSERKVWQFAFELASALSHLHTHHIIHRDVKCLNVLLTKDHHVKLGDLGASKIALQSALHLTRVGTPLYLAPELVKQQAYDEKVDVWALGCVLYLLAAFEAPFQGENILALGSAIVNKQPKPIPAAYSPHLWTFIQRLLTKHAAQRPTISEALDMLPIEGKASLGALSSLEDQSTNFTSAGKEEISGGKTGDQVKRKVKIPNHLKELIRQLENPTIRSTVLSPRTLQAQNPVVRTQGGAVAAQSEEMRRKYAASVLSLRPKLLPEAPVYENVSCSPAILPKSTLIPTVSKLHSPELSKPLVSALKSPEKDMRSSCSSAVIEAKEPLILVKCGRIRASEEDKAVFRRLFAPIRPKTAGHRVRLMLDQPSSPSPKPETASNALNIVPKPIEKGVNVRPATARTKSERSNPLFRPAKLATLLRPSSTWTIATSSHSETSKKRLSVKDLY
jgi:serine/threonine protein kinase